MSNHDPALFYTAITEQRHFVPEEPQTRGTAHYVDALRSVTQWAAVYDSNLTLVTNSLGTVTGDGSKPVGYNEMATVHHSWRLDDGRFISLYQVER